MAIIGERIVRREDPSLLMGAGTFIDNLALDGLAVVTYARSQVAHARVTSIDTSEAASAPGVIGVFTAADLDLGSVPVDLPMLTAPMPRPFLADGVVRYVGEPIVAIVAESKAQAEDAAERVIVDYDPLPVVIEPESALEGEVLLFPEAGTNVCFQLPSAGADLFAECEVVVRRRITNQKVAPCPIEARVAASRWEPDGRLTHWQAGQGAHPIRDRLAAVYGLPVDQIRSISPDVGGGFGAKAFSYPEDLLLPWLARRVGRPVRYSDNRTDSMLGLGHGRGQVQHIEIGGTRDGKVLAYRLTVLQDTGAYPRMSAILPFMTTLMLTGTYAIPAAECVATSVVTNTVPMVAYRGAGRPEAAAAIERAMDLFAHELGLDPVDVRRRNLVGPDRFPYVTATGTTYDSGRYEAALDAVLAAADHDALRAEQRRRREAGERVQLGIGVSVYVEITALSGGGEYGHVEVLPTGKVRVLTGTSPYGQGHHTSWAMLVSDKLGVAMDDIEVIHGDTDIVPAGSITGGSRSVQLGGTNVWRAAGVVLDQARDLAARLLEADPADIVLDDGRFHVAGTPALAKTWAELAAAKLELDGGPLAGLGDFSQAGGTFPSGAHVAVVDVDIETGKVVVRRIVAVDDAGRILNPLLAEGQVHGGLAQGVAQALLEEVVYDDDGNPLTTNFADYAVISAAELPSFETVHLETPSPLNDLGATGIGESGTIGSTPAVQSAVVDALSHLGVDHVDMPCTPQRVWAALNAVG
ncbi:MAG TPA: xanthine dehydrogenase family protein molybdopterin-binding subunit [Ilumatobacteraceae bacterium]